MRLAPHKKCAERFMPVFAFCFFDNKANGHLAFVVLTVQEVRNTGITCSGDGSIRHYHVLNARCGFWCPSLVWSSVPVAEF